MTVRWLFAALHLIALGIGLGAIWGRAGALRSELTERGLRRAFAADTWWGVAALIWIGTGLVRAFGGLEKGAPHYLHNHLFLTKMGLLALILALEALPMVTLIRWRRAERPDRSIAPSLARITYIQAGLVVAMVIAATGMARGLGQ